MSIVLKTSQFLMISVFVVTGLTAAYAQTKPVLTLTPETTGVEVPGESTSDLVIETPPVGPTIDEILSGTSEAGCVPGALGCANSTSPTSVEAINTEIVIIDQRINEIGVDAEKVKELVIQHKQAATDLTIALDSANKQRAQCELFGIQLELARTNSKSSRVIASRESAYSNCQRRFNTYHIAISTKSNALEAQIRTELESEQEYNQALTDELAGLIAERVGLEALRAISFLD